VVTGLTSAALGGTMFLPRGGTSELGASAKATTAVVVPEGKKGPNGGPIDWLVAVGRLWFVSSTLA
jgi:hypothetical protein